MRIGIVLASPPGYSETFFTNKIKGLQARGYHVVLFVESNKHNIVPPCKMVMAPNLSGNPFSIFMTSCYALFKSLLFNFSKTSKLYDLNMQDNYTIGKQLKSIIINSLFFSEQLDWLHFGFGTMALQRENVAKAIGAKMAVSFRGFDIGIYPVKNPGCYSRVWPKVNKVHVISDDLAQQVIKEGFPVDGKMTKICPAIDTKYFVANDHTRNGPRMELVTVGRLHWKKGLEYTLQALSQVKQQGIAFHYTIVGEGFEMERLKFAVHQLGLANDVSFAGRLAPEEVKSKLQNADVYLQYSIQEGFCNAVLEAQAIGMICIVSDAEGLPENVLDKVTGFVVPKRKPAALSNQIMEVSRMSMEEKRTISRNASARVKEQFNIEKQIGEFISFYED